MANFAYVTLVNSPDYVTGAVALKRSLDRIKCQTPLVCMVISGSCNTEPLHHEGCEVIDVAPMAFSSGFIQRHSRDALHKKAPFDKGGKPGFHNPLNNFCKLKLWTLTQFDKVVFLDADTLVLKSIDHLFHYPEFSAAPNVYDNLDGFQRMNSGVFVARPSFETYERMFGQLDAPDAFWRRTDQTFLQEFWPSWHGLPYIYNALQYLYINLPELWSWQHLHVIHYQYEKPWQQDHPKKELLKPLIDLWWSVYQQQDTNALLSDLVKREKHD